MSLYFGLSNDYLVAFDISCQFASKITRCGTGGHLIDNTVLKHLKKIVTNIGIPETRFHDLRHTYATNAIRIGDPIKTVSENLGHATVAFTLDVYGHVTPAMKQDSAERMQRLIDSCS